MMRTAGLDRDARQPPCAAAVVIVSLGRASLIDAVRSVFAQDWDRPIHILIGIDRMTGDPAGLDRILAESPPERPVSVLDPGYSTSQQYNGLHLARDGGAMRTILSYLAHSRFVAYLDDDNWFAPDHVRSLAAPLIAGDAQWSFSRRWFVEPGTDTPLAVDDFESVGPDGGAYASPFGGWVDPNCLMIDKIVCQPVLKDWAVPLAEDPTALTADRRVFAHLKKFFIWQDTGQPTVYYRMNPSDWQTAHRYEAIAHRRDAGTTL